MNSESRPYAPKEGVADVGENRSSEMVWTLPMNLRVCRCNGAIRHIK